MKHNGRSNFIRHVVQGHHSCSTRDADQQHPDDRNEPFDPSEMKSFCVAHGPPRDNLIGRVAERLKRSACRDPIHSGASRDV
jgi:hypothetical protein